MLSNLVAKSNMIDWNKYGHFECCSITELMSIFNRCPLLITNPLDVINEDYLTEEQREQREQRLFWGDKKISMKDDNREEKWFEDLAQQAFPRWERVRTQLDIELAWEWLWFCEYVLCVSEKYSAKANNIIEPGFPI